ncbi:MAG: HAD family hydrolase [Curvibacter sp. GWA2_64_110]|nr:MAG: HAD family hydrolase [Curvibacter sp. GWA2_64_110]HCY17437.1 HAD family hydrolase [Curvibacter sp.]
MRFDAVLFDCDGVLVDSEPIVNRVLRDMLAERGWVLTAEECWRIFVGKAVKDEQVRIERHTGQPLTEEWLAGFRQRRNAALEAELSVIANAHAAVHEVHARHDARIACASGADRHKVELQLRKVGLFDYFAGRIFSGHELPRSKPHPDVYLAAAAALAAPPQRCAVVEDTLTGVAAGVAAGATVFAYVPQGDAEVFRRAGAVEVFGDMAQLPDVLR